MTHVIDHLTCDLRETNCLFVLASGHSRSSTVLNMINAIPSVYSDGENVGAFNSIYHLPVTSETVISRILQAMF